MFRLLRIATFVPLVFLLVSEASFGQKDIVAVQTPSSDSLKILSLQMFNGNTDMARYEANDKFNQLLKRDLFSPDAFTYSFDSIRILSVLSSSDKKFRFFTWTLPLASDKFETFGLMLVFSEKSHTYKVIELKDVSNEIVNPEKEILKKGVWYGAVYYQLIEKKFKGEKFYTVIGWNGANALYQQKVVDIITFDRNDEPIFGKLLFRGKGFFGNKRLIFRYSDKVVMKLRYELQTYTIIKSKERTRHNKRINKNNDEALKAPKKKKKAKVKSEELIVFDQIVPLRPELVGQYQFYYPLSETGNAFYFEDGRWIHRQISTSDDSTGVKKPQNGLLPENK